MEAQQRLELAQNLPCELRASCCVPEQGARAGKGSRHMPWGGGSYVAVLGHWEVEYRCEGRVLGTQAVLQTQGCGQFFTET